MLYAAVDKVLLDPRFLQATGVGSIGETLNFFAKSGGPIAGIVEAVALPQPVLIGASMAFAQLLVGASLLTGSWVRLGALLGAGISLALALTSTWGVSPYYYGNDLPYLVGFLALAALGDGGALRLGAPASKARHRISGRVMRLPAAPREACDKASVTATMIRLSSSLPVPLPP